MYLITGIRGRDRTIEVLADLILATEDLELPETEEVRQMKRVFARLSAESKVPAERRREKARAQRRRRSQRRIAEREAEIRRNRRIQDAESDDGLGPEIIIEDEEEFLRTPPSED